MKRFLLRQEAEMFRRGRKLYAKSFLYSMKQRCFIVTGNRLRRVSYSAWDRSVSKRQETIRKRFPTRHDTEAAHSDGKLYAKGFLYGMG